MTMTYRIIPDEQKRAYMSLLLLADPSEAMIDNYLDQGTMYGAFEGGRIACIAVIVELDQDRCELKNLAVDPGLWHRGYGSSMLQFLRETYAGRYKELFVGTSQNGVSFYTDHGFAYSHTVPAFFTENYPEPLIENGVQCVDMIYLKHAL